MLLSQRIIPLFFLGILTFCKATPLWAGLIEIGLSANQKNSNFDANNFQKTISYTGSISYYFWELSAVEFSCTKGQSELSTKVKADPTIKYITQFQMFGIDFVYAFAGRQSMIQPYVKLGMAILDKEIFRELENGEVTTFGEQQGEVPSAGIGMKIVLSQKFRIKIGLDGWDSPKNDENPLNFKNTAARAGITWLF